jgi:hypothetical protein
MLCRILSHFKLSIDPFVPTPPPFCRAGVWLRRLHAEQILSRFSTFSSWHTLHSPVKRSRISACLQASEQYFFSGPFFGCRTGVPHRAHRTAPSSCAACCTEIAILTTQSRHNPLFSLTKPARPHFSHFPCFIFTSLRQRLQQSVHPIHEKFNHHKAHDHDQKEPNRPHDRHAPSLLTLLVE